LAVELGWDLIWVEGGGQRVFCIAANIARYLTR